jgi:hypothetical protein
MRLNGGDGTGAWCKRGGTNAPLCSYTSLRVMTTRTRARAWLPPSGGTSRCAGTVCKRTYRCHLWFAILAQKPPMLCPKGHQPFGTHAKHATFLMHFKCCNFRPTGPFGITLLAGCAMDGVVGLIPHCHWPSRTIYGTSRRVASSCGPEAAGTSADQ